MKRSSAWSFAVVASIAGLACLGVVAPAGAGTDRTEEPSKNVWNWKNASSGPKKVEKFHWDGHLEKGKSLEIHGVNGDIRVEASSGDRVTVDAEKSARRSDPSEVEIKVDQDGDGVLVCALYPGPGNECGRHGDYHSHTHNNDVEVDFVVHIPAGVKLDAGTVNGAIHVDDLSGPVTAHSVNGSIEISTSGWAEASTVNGNIHASMGNTRWTDDLQFETVNGGIVVELPENADAEVHGETMNGTITTDFPITIRGKLSRRRIDGTIGEGGRQLDLESVNGSIHLRRSS